MPTKSCFNCGYHGLNAEKCPLIGFAYPQTANSQTVCPYWTAELPICDHCGQISPNSVLSQSADNSWKNLCINCLQKSGTCELCSHGGTCDFETNPSTVPKVVQKQFRQGNQIMVTTIKNPERIRMTCQENCECFSEKFGCLRENGTCEKYEGVV